MVGFFSFLVLVVVENTDWERKEKKKACEKRPGIGIRDGYGFWLDLRIGYHSITKSFLIF